jgi:hypothetical protein
MIIEIMIVSVLFGAITEKEWQWFSKIEGHFFVHVMRLKKLKK